MGSYRKIGDDILKEWLDFRKSIGLAYTDDENKKHSIYFDEISKRILKTFPN